MTITIFKQDEHPAGFVGIRVMGTDSHGKRFQKYWNYKGRSTEEKAAMLKEAKALNKEIQDYRKRKHANHAYHKTSAVHKTAVARINLLIALKRGRSNKKRPEKGKLFEFDYGYPCFLASPFAGYKKGKHEKQFLISKLGYQGAWEAAVNYWCSNDDEYSAANREAVLAAIPHPRRFLALYRKMVKDLRPPPKSVLNDIKQWITEFEG